MAAVVVNTSTLHRRVNRGQRRPVEPLSDRPALRLLPGGAEACLRRRQAPHVYRRRRLVAACLAACVLALLAVPAVVVGLPAGQAGVHGEGIARDAPSPAVAAAGTPLVGTTGGTVHVVRPGDTVWSIAEGLGVGGDVRVVVDELVRRAGGADLTVGERIPLDGLTR